VDLELRGDGILVTLAEGLKAQADLRLGLRGDPAALKLAGEVRVLKARYLREFTDKPPPIAAANGDGAGPAPPPAAGLDLSRMALDIKVRSTDNVWIANPKAKIEAALALDVGGTLAAPAVSGEITAIRGEAFYLSREFRIESGSLRFTPAAAVPRLDVQASTSVGETQILFLMDGPVNNLSYHLVSLPPMSEEDIIALLTIGETRAGLARGGDSSASAGAAVFTTEPLVNALGDEARSSMGLEVLQLEPVVAQDSAVSAKVTLGTRLSDRVFVSYSQNLGAVEDQQVAVRYYLLDYLSLWGQQMRQGIYSLDLVFRHTFR
jgi:translocation and assembly module TamB